MNEEKGSSILFLRRAFTAVELRKKLCRKGFSLDTIEAVIKDFMRRYVSTYMNGMC